MRCWSPVLSQKQQADLDRFFAEAEDILDNWRPDGDAASTDDRDLDFFPSQSIEEFDRFNVYEEPQNFSSVSLTTEFAIIHEGINVRSSVWPELGTITVGNSAVISGTLELELDCDAESLERFLQAYRDRLEFNAEWNENPHD